jgi:carbohydrate kinase (thermoresistant glucokinase family)
VLAERLGWPYLDGDDLHPATNVAKMAAGHPLTDADRAPWLRAIRAQLNAWHAAGIDGVLACSALRRAYRDVLRDGPGEVRFVYLDVDPDVLAARLAHRQGHFMPGGLLASQLATLEPPAPDEYPIRIVVHDNPVVDDVVTNIVDHLLPGPTPAV